MALDESGDVCRIRGLTDVVGDIEGEEIAGSDEAINGAEIYVVRIEEVFAGPAEIGDGLVGGVTGGLWLGADDGVLTVGFVPDRGDVDAELFGRDEGFELSVGAVGETIADSEGVFWTGFHNFLRGLNRQ